MRLKNVILWVEAPQNSCHLAMFGACWSSASGDLTYSIFHVTSQDTLWKGYVTLWVGAPHGRLLPSLGAKSIVTVEIKCF